MSTACARGCSIYRRHLDECEGINDETCQGCLPRPARHGRLCDTCYRRLELMLTDAPTVVRWLSGNMAAGASAARAKQDHERVTRDGTDVPTPLKLELLDLRDLLVDRLTLWVDDWCEHKGLAGPGHHSPETDARYLLTWLPGVAGLEWIGDWWEEMAETLRDAHNLAPWRPAMRRIPRVPCPGCGENTLVIFGGEVDVTCLSCRIMMTEDRFELWERVLQEQAS